MQVEEVTGFHAFLSSAGFLSAEELVSVRKQAEETSEPIVGEKLYTRSVSRTVENMLKYALEGYKKTLDKKRVARLCDLIKARWNPELNIVTVPKLKGKFTQHMGHLKKRQHILAPEEAIFLVENNCIEIMNGKIPMSTEEAFNIILKENLSLEKYQVYAYLSRFGYVTVLHQTELHSTALSADISFDVYPPGFTYKKTCPQIPKYRIVVVRSTDPILNYSDIASLQCKWNDGSTLLIAVNDNGNLSFQSFNRVSLPSMTPHKD